MRKFLISLCFVGFLSILLGVFYEEIVVLYYNAIKYFDNENIKLVKNDYFKKNDFLFVQNTINYEPTSSKDITNLFYTILNSGQDEFTFHCSRKYNNCLNDIKLLLNDQSKLSHINNFVHPFNSFKHVEIQYTSNGEVSVLISRNYSDADINVINEKVNNIYMEIVSENNSDIENIREVHDYIINNSKYDSGRSDYNALTYRSDIAYGPLFEGYGICGGYSDAMALFLEKMGILNYKVSSETHVWNVLQLDGMWYHLDLTWDDPISSDGKDYLQHEYFLLTTEDLMAKEFVEHEFDMDFYLELKTQ